MASLLDVTHYVIEKYAGRAKCGCRWLSLVPCLASMLVSSLASAESLLSSSEFQSEPLALTAEEQQWLEQHPQVVFSGDPNWLPFEAFTDDGQYIGIVAAHLDLISKSSGLKFKLSPSKTWTESTEKAKQGSIDVLSETDDSDLKSHLDFTRSYLSNPIVIAMRINENYVENIDAIKDRRIALIKDYGYASKIRRKYSDIDFITVADIQDGLISVSTGKVDALLCTLALCGYTLHELGLSDVKITGKTEFDTKLALGIQKNNPILLSILNKAIDNIDKGQQQQILNEWVKYDYIEKTDYTLVYLITIVSIVLLSFFYYWNRRLFNEVELRKTAEQQLITSSNLNERYRILFYESQIGHALNDFDSGDFISVNQAFCEITGYTLEEMNQLSYWDMTPESYADQEWQQIESLKANGNYGPYEKEYIHKDGHRVNVRLNGSLITDVGGEKLILSVVEDISDYAQTKERLQLSSMVLQNSSEAMMITDQDNKIIAINPAFTTITGYELDEVVGQIPSHFKSDRHDQEFFDNLWQSLQELGKWQGEVWDIKKSGEVYAKWLTINTVIADEGNIKKYISLFSDITERKLSEETIWKQANFDDLTGLPNRTYFHEQLGKLVIEHQKSGKPITLLLIDLDTFKEVNDTLGHDKGDQLLKIAAKRIFGCVRSSDIVARLGGDEFTVTLPGFGDNADIDVIAEKIMQKLSRPYHLDNEVAHTSASIGITTFPQDASNIETLIKNADQAMYASKNQGRNRFSYFTQSLQDKAQKRLQISNDLRNALKDNQFEVYYQPIVELASNKISKAEALLRWHHPESGMIPPDEFINVAEEIGIISDVGNWVCCEVNRFQNVLYDDHDHHIEISVNMSPVQFKMPNTVFGDGWLALYQQDSRHKLTLEITEGLLLTTEPEILEKLHLLRDAGIEVSIDDFGTGYSSLSYLKKFHIDYLKIDRSFINNIKNDPNDLALTEAIIVMAHKLGLKVIAEGVEKQEQEDLLSSAGCDYAQGYLYSRPIPSDKFITILNQRTLRKEEDPR